MKLNDDQRMILAAVMLGHVSWRLSEVPNETFSRHGWMLGDRDVTVIMWKWFKRGLVDAHNGPPLSDVGTAWITPKGLKAL